MFSMFAGQRKLSSLTGLSNWDTLKVKNMAGTFQYLASLQDLDLSNWKTGSVTTMREMFGGDTKLEQIKGLSNLDLSKVTDTSQMFIDTDSLDQIDLSQNVKPTNLADSSEMFGRSGSRLINLSGWDLTNSKVTNMFAELKKPATIVLNNVKADYGTVTDRVVPTQLDIMAFAGAHDVSKRMPLVVISNNPTFVKNLNDELLFYSTGDMEQARQKEDYFDLKGEIGNTTIDLGTVPMDLAYPSEDAVYQAVVNKIEQHLQEDDSQNGTDYAQRWLKSLDVENNRMKPSTHALAQNLAAYFTGDYVNSLPAIITGTYTIDLSSNSGDNGDTNTPSDDNSDDTPSSSNNEVPVNTDDNKAPVKSNENESDKSSKTKKVIKKTSIVHGTSGFEWNKRSRSEEAKQSNSQIQPKSEVGKIRTNNSKILPRTSEHQNNVLEIIGLVIVTISGLLFIDKKRKQN